MKLHLLGLPHTITSAEYSHCAFTGKVLRFPAMMAPLGYKIVHYGVEGPDVPGAYECVHVMTRSEQIALLGHDGSDPRKLHSDDANTDSPLYHEFNRRLRKLLIDRVTMADLVLLPFGHGHHEALADLPFRFVETGIGYPTLYDRAPFKIFESYAWLHFHHGLSQRWDGNNYEWVVPNYFDLADWPGTFGTFTGPRTGVVFMGRLLESKGLPTVVAVAKARPDIQFTICGQGDPTPWLTEPNIKYLEPIFGPARASLLGQARAVIMPTNFIEPFGGVAVEAMLCGTPVVTTSYGAFTETVEDEVTGWRCHTLGEFLYAIDNAPQLDHRYIRRRAQWLYGYARVGAMYDRVFQQIADLPEPGWYSERVGFVGRQ